MHVDGDLRVIYGANPLAAAVNNDKIKNAQQGTDPNTKTCKCYIFNEIYVEYC
jgi:hypothetical protein